MKNFITKNKLAIIMILTFISDLIIGIQDKLDIPENYQFIIQVVGIFTSLLLIRLQAINELNEKRQLALRSANPNGKFISVRIRLHTMLWDLFKKIFGYLRPQYLFKGNGPSHLLLGAAMLFICCILPIPNYGYGRVWILSVLSIAGFGLGIIIELVQIKYFEATGEESDVFVTGYGYLFAIPLGLLFLSFALPMLIYIITAVLCVVLAFIIHKDF